jgi:hypothetical protein
MHLDNVNEYPLLLCIRGNMGDESCKINDETHI